VDWASLRRQREYGHAIRAVLQLVGLGQILVAFVALLMSLLAYHASRGEQRDPAGAARRDGSQAKTQRRIGLGPVHFDEFWPLGAMDDATQVTSYEMTCVRRRRFRCSGQSV
jgi:hypothetical protein